MHTTLFFRLSDIGIAFLSACLLSGCATLLSGDKESIAFHCSESEGVLVLANGSQMQPQNGIFYLDKSRDAHFVTFKKEGYYENTISFDREINPIWPVANLIWGPFCPLGWLVDWQTDSVYEIAPRDIRVVIKKMKE